MGQTQHTPHPAGSRSAAKLEVVLRNPRLRHFGRLKSFATASIGTLLGQAQLSDPPRPYPAQIESEIAEQIAGWSARVYLTSAQRRRCPAYIPATRRNRARGRNRRSDRSARATRCLEFSNVGFDLRPILCHHGFEELARHSTLSFEENVTKPDPRIFRAALGTVSAEPAETLMVGDRPEADGAAAELGLRTLIWPMSPPGAEHGLDRVLRVAGTPSPRA